MCHCEHSSNAKIPQGLITHKALPLEHQHSRCTKLTRDYRVAQMAQFSSMYSISSVLVLALLSACGGGSSNDVTPVVREEGGPRPLQDNFPTFSITFPPELELISAENVDIDTDAPQTSIRAAIFTDADRQLFELLCQVIVFVSDIDSAELAYVSLFELTTFSVVSTDSIQNGERSGIEILFSNIQNDGVALSGLAHAFYFNANSDNLTRSSTHVIECIAPTQIFNNRRPLIDQVLDSVMFGSDVAGRDEMNAHSISESGQIMQR